VASYYLRLPLTGGGGGDAVDITSTPSGNLAASNVQTALNELQTDIDTRATAASVTTEASTRASADTTEAAARAAADALLELKIYDPTTYAPILFDDFINGVNSGEPYGAMGWDSISNGTGGGNVQVAVASGDKGTTVGAWRLTCGITPNSNYGGIIGNQSAFLFGSSTVTFAARFKLVTLADATDDYYFKIGFSNTYPTTQHGAYLMYDRANSVNWRTVTSKASADTIKTSTTAVDTNWHVAKIVITNDTSVDFYLDGVLLTAQHTTNIPTASGQICGPTLVMLKTAGTLNRSWDLDWTYLQYTLGSARGTF
jgi:hypothetical protein